MEGKKYLAEAIGTFALVFVAVGVVMSNQGSANSLGGLAVALAYGLAAYAIYSSADVDLNPAVTAAKWIVKKTDAVSGIITVIAQLVGAVIAAYLLRSIFGDVATAAHSGMVSLGAQVTTQTGVLVEAILSGLLIWVWLGSGKSAPSGFVYTLSVLVAGSLTGGAINPARAFGPAFAEGNWLNHWVYWVGPLIGAIVAAIVYEYTMSEGAGSANGRKR